MLWRAVLFGDRELETLVIRVDRHVAELAAALVADGDPRHERVEHRVDQRRGDQHDHAQVKPLPRRREHEERHGGGDDDREAELLWKILADEQVPAAAVGANGKTIFTTEARSHGGALDARTRLRVSVSPW